MSRGMAHINAPAVMEAINAASRAPAEGALLDFRWGTGATIKELFKLFDRDRDGKLTHAEYAAFCEATEGQGCDAKRWAQHCCSLGVADPDAGMPLENFGRLCASMLSRDRATLGVEVDGQQVS
eukprot:COSAG01_NODE_3763_length_5720_cov_3.247109_6_plen_124_part_00